VSHLLAVDVGTSSVKAGLVSTDGKLTRTASREYTLATPRPHWCEIDPQVYWDCICSAVREVVADGDPAETLALSVSSQGETVIAVGNDSKPLGNAIVWLDDRAQQEAEEIAERFGRDLFYQRTGLECGPGWTGPKLLWLRRHEPELFTQTARFLNVMDYVLLRMTGEAVTEPSLCQSTGYKELSAQTWWREMLDYIGLQAGQLPRIATAGETVGHLLPEAAAELGLSDRTWVVVGAMDQLAGAVGAGNVAPGSVTETTGSALAIVATVDNIVLDPARRVPCVAHALRGRYVLLPYAPTAGMMLKWFRDQVLQANVSYGALTAQAAAVPPGCDGLVAVPHLAGSLCPDNNPSARAAFVGLSLNHTQAHLVRAILESIAFLLADNINLIRDLGVAVTSVRSMGGGANSDLWLQMKADVLDLAVERVAEPEAALLGDGAFAGVAVGVWSNIEAAVAQVARTSCSFAPDRKRFDAYRQAHERCRETYARLYGNHSTSDRAMTWASGRDR
jgi:xylulokinase